MEKEQQEIGMIGTEQDSQMSIAGPDDIAVQQTDPSADTADKEEADISEEGQAVPETDPSQAPPAQNAKDAADEHAGQTEETVYMPVYNGEVIPVKASDREQITTLLQLGMKQKAFLPEYEALRQLACDIGAPSVKGLVELLSKQHEERLQREALERYGEEDGKRFYELQRAERLRRFDRETAALEEEQHEKEREAADRLAEQFVELQTAYPQFADIRQVPYPVVQTALQKGISLLDAQNRFVLSEQRRAAQSRRAQEQAARESTGSLADNGEQPENPEMEAFRNGLYARGQMG
ncbi:MAG: hypothetical protein ACI39E_02040 [Acutalibacteraceae bacterium]